MDDAFGAIGSLIFFGLILWVISGLMGGESQGTVKYDDCRQVINTKQGNWDTYFKKFTGEDYRSKSGRLISGTYVHIDTSGGACTTAYVYEKKSDFNCGDNSTPNYDDSVYACNCDNGYHSDPTDNRKPCILGNPTPSPSLTPVPTVAPIN